MGHQTPGPSTTNTDSTRRHSVNVIRSMRSFTDTHYSTLLESLENVLHHVGDMGRYQFILFFLMIPACFFFAVVLFGQMFIAATPQFYWCRIPELEHLDIKLRRRLAAPGAANSDSWDKCNTYLTDWNIVLETMKPPHPSTPTIPCPHGWDFDFTDIPYPTVVTERGWVCDKSRNAPIAQAFFFLGAFVGGITFGWMADNYGRVPTLMAANVAGCVGGVSTTLTSYLWDFALCRFLVGISYDTNFMMIYILLMEYVGPQHRSWVANISISSFFGCGCMILPWLALWVADWRRLMLITSLPMLIFVASPWIVPESVRWLVHVGKINEAVKVLKKFERINGRKIPKDVFDEFLLSCEETDHSHETLLMLLRRPLLRTSQLIMVFVYMSCAVAFDGLVRMSDHLGLNFFITFTLTSATEIPSSIVLALTLDRIGRRNLTAIPLMICGTLLLCAVFLPKGIPQTAVAITARFFINLANCVTTQWCTELLPTGLRATGSAIIHVSGFLSSVWSPFIVYSEIFWVFLPLLILGIVALSSASASTALPETTHLAMPQTIKDAEAIVRENTICKTKRFLPISRPRIKYVAS